MGHIQRPSMVELRGRVKFQNRSGDSASVDLAVSAFKMKTSTLQILLNLAGSKPDSTDANKMISL